MTIPKVLHRLWLGPEELPPYALDFGQRWAELHPHWEMRLWTDRDLPALINQALFDSIETWAGKADVARYEILYQFGGIYADCDMEPLRAIDSLLDNAVGFFAGREDEERVSNALMGSVPQHVVLRSLIEQLPGRAARMAGGQPELVTGPVALTQVLESTSATDVLVLDPAAFFPYHYREKWKRWDVHDGAYAVHHWAGSWQGSTWRTRLRRALGDAAGRRRVGRWLLERRAVRRHAR